MLLANYVHFKFQSLNYYSQFLNRLGFDAGLGFSIFFVPLTATDGNVKLLFMHN